MSDLGSTRQESEVTIAFPISFGVESLQGRLLVLSIRKFISKTIRIIAFRPPHSLSLTDDTLSLFDEMNVETIMTSPKLYYKYGDRSLRKIDFLSNGTFFENILLLDPSLIFIKTADLADLIPNNIDFLAQTAFKKEVVSRGDLISLIKRSPWYRHSFQMVEPFLYNDGAVFVGGESNFSKNWESVTSWILSDKDSAENIRSRATQIALTVIFSLGLNSASHLPRGWNCTPNAIRDAVLVNYFSSGIALKSAMVSRIFENLSGEADEVGLNALGELTIKDLRTILSK